MEKLEGEEGHTPGQPLLAYVALEAEQDTLPGAPVRREGTAYGDVVTSFATRDILVLQDVLNKQETIVDPGSDLPVVSELDETHVQLERQRSAHRSEMVRARARYCAEQEERQRIIASRRIASPPPKPPSAPIGRDAQLIGRVLAATGVAALSVATFLFWPRLSRWSQERAFQVIAASRRPVLVLPEAPTLPAPGAQMHFQNSVGRLSRALAARRGRTPEDLLREVHERYKALDPNFCSFSWSNGQPALLFSGWHKSGGHTSVEETILRCADAVEKLP